MKINIKQLIQYSITFAGGVLLTLSIQSFDEKYNLFQHFDTINDIPIEYYKNQKIIQGEIVKVIDGDTYKLYHLNTWQQYFNPIDKSLSKSLTIRIAGIDTPEIAKKKESGQKYGNEAKLFAEKKLLNKVINLKILSKDRYNRVLGIVYNQGSITTKQIDIAEELLQEGLAVVYRQGGATYGGKKDIYEKLEKQAIEKQKGIWSDGPQQVELPSVYKQKLKQQYQKQ